MAGSTFASRSYRDAALVLRTQKLGEADRIITVLTPSHGVVRGVAKGVRRTRSKFGAVLEPFMAADVQFVHGRSLEIITQAQMRGDYGRAIVSDYEKYTAASAMAETAERVADGTDHRDRTQFDLLHGALAAMARGAHAPELILGSYLLRSMSIAGWAVTWSACVACGEPGAQPGFHAGVGGPVCDACRPPGTRSLPPGAGEFLQALQQGQWEQAEGVAADIRHESLSVATEYAQHHMERGLRSLRAIG